MGFYPAGPFEQLHHRSSRVGRIIISSIFRLASETGLIVSRDVAHDHQRQRYDRRPSNEPPTGLTRTLYVCTVCTYTRMNILLVDACISLTSGQLDPTHRLTPPPPPRPQRLLQSDWDHHHPSTSVLLIDGLQHHHLPSTLTARNTLDHQLAHSIVGLGVIHPHL